MAAGTEDRLQPQQRQTTSHQRSNTGRPINQAGLLHDAGADGRLVAGNGRGMGEGDAFGSGYESALSTWRSFGLWAWQSLSQEGRAGQAAQGIQLCE